MNGQDYIDTIYLYGKDLSEYEILIKKRKDVGIKHLNDPNAFIKWFNTMDDIYENINGLTQTKKMLTVFEKSNHNQGTVY